MTTMSNYRRLIYTVFRHNAHKHKRNRSRVNEQQQHYENDICKKDQKKLTIYL